MAQPAAGLEVPSQQAEQDRHFQCPPLNPQEPSAITTLLPQSPREELSESHQVYFLLDLVEELDLSAILIPAEAKHHRGEKGFDPRM
jgi:hypothetical protein